MKAPGLGTSPSATRGLMTRAAGRRGRAVLLTACAALVTAWAMTAALGGGPSGSQAEAGHGATPLPPWSDTPAVAVAAATAAPATATRPAPAAGALRAGASALPASTAPTEAIGIDRPPSDVGEDDVPLDATQRDGSALALVNFNPNPKVSAWVMPPSEPGSDPEARLLAAYRVLASDGPAAVLPLIRSLVKDHPGFSLAHMLHGDVLATLAGQPRAFDIDGHTNTQPDDRRIVLREEARRRWSALTWRPPHGTLPLEFLQFAADVRHAVAIDTSRSRLYLFENGPTGMVLKRDLYISVGRLGAGKQVEGDQRTPLGLYWITTGYRAPMRDPRLGEAALGINYPNAWDRELGRTGRGLFLHGVPRHLLAHVPQATDGCVAMSNDDAIELLQTLDPGTTPVLIAPQLQWVRPDQTQAFHREFLKALTAWQRAMQAQDLRAVTPWYEARIKPVTWDKAGPAASSSILGWYGDGKHVVIVTSRHPHADNGQPGWLRQYWVRQPEGWRVIFDGIVPMRQSPGSQDAARRAASRAASPQG